MLKDKTGRSSSSSSECSGDKASSGMVDVSEIKDSFDTWVGLVKREWRVWYTGEDSGRR